MGVKPRFVIHDRDRKYPDAFKAFWKSESVRRIPIPLKALMANAFTESWIESCKREALNYFMCFWLGTTGCASEKRVLCGSSGGRIRTGDLWVMSTPGGIALTYWFSATCSDSNYLAPRASEPHVIHFTHVLQILGYSLARIFHE